MQIDGTITIPRHDVLTAWQKVQLEELEAFFVDPISSDAAVVRDGFGYEQRGIPGEKFIAESPTEEFVTAINPENLTSMIDWRSRIELVDHITHQSEEFVVNADIEWIGDGKWQLWIGFDDPETGEIQWIPHDETYDHREHAEHEAWVTENPTRIERLDD